MLIKNMEENKIMNVYDFTKKYPQIVKKAEQCKNFEEFESLANENNLNFENADLKQIYEFLQEDDELSEDVLNNVAGGIVPKKEIVVKLKRVEEPMTSPTQPKVVVPENETVQPVGEGGNTNENGLK